MAEQDTGIDNSLDYAQLERELNIENDDAEKRAKRKYYLTNADLLPEVIKSKNLGKMTERLAAMLMMLVNKYSLRPNFVGYSYRNDMCSTAIVNLVQNALKFDPEKSSNPFAFYTTAIHRSFLQYMEYEKKHRYIRDSLLVDQGFDPSFNFDESFGANKSAEPKESEEDAERRREFVEKERAKISEKSAKGRKKKAETSNTPSGAEAQILSDIDQLLDLPESSPDLTEAESMDSDKG